MNKMHTKAFVVAFTFSKDIISTCNLHKDHQPGNTFVFIKMKNTNGYIEDRKRIHSPLVHTVTSHPV